MANFNFGEFKTKVSQVAEDIAGKSVAALNTAADKASLLAKKAKLNAEIASEKEHMKKSYMALGQLYFEKYCENADPDFSQAIAELNISASKIEEKKCEIEKLNEEVSACEDEAVSEEPETEGTGCCCGEKSEKTEGEGCCCGEKSEKTEGEGCCCGEKSEETKDEGCCCEKPENSESTECCCGEKSEETEPEQPQE